MCLLNMQDLWPGSVSSGTDKCRSPRRRAQLNTRAWAWSGMLASLCVIVCSGWLVSLTEAQA